MELINVEPTRPKWAELASVHGIETSFDENAAVWKAEIDDFAKIENEMGESPREAVVRLIHRLQLTGWQEVTV